MNTARIAAWSLAAALLALTAISWGAHLSIPGVAQAGPPAALTPPANVSVANTADGHVIVRWDDDAAPVHRVGWANAGDVATARAAGDWLEAFHFADTKRNTDYTVKYLPQGQRYWFIVGAGNYRFGGVAWNEWQSLITIAPTTLAPVDKVKVAAPIESVDIIVAESYPPQYFVSVVSGLPGGCAEFYGYAEQRSGNVINITVSNLEPAPSVPVACTADYRYHEFSVPLGTDFEPGKTYTVKVNDVTRTFVAEGAPDGDSGDGAVGGHHGVIVPAPIESVAIHVDAGAGGEDYLVVTYGLPNACYDLYSSELSDEAGVFTVKILNQRTDRDGDGNPVACAQIYLTEEARLLIASDVQVGGVYDVTVNGKKRAVTATAAP